MMKFLAVIAMVTPAPARAAWTRLAPLPPVALRHCAPAHVTTNGVPYVIADNLILLVAAENLATGTRPGIAADLIARHADMSYEQVVRDILYTLSFKPDGALKNSFSIFHTADLAAASLRKYTKAEILAEETYQHNQSLDTGVRYLDTQWYPQYRDAIACNDARRIANLLAIRYFIQPPEGYLFPWW